MKKKSPLGTQKKKKGKALTVILVLLAVAAVLLALYAVQRSAREQDASLVTPEEAARCYRPSVSYQGESYPLKRNTSSLLLIGTDNFVDDKKQHEGLSDLPRHPVRGAPALRRDGADADHPVPFLRVRRGGQL